MNTNRIERRLMSDCVICENPVCTQACGKLDCGKILRSIKFANEIGAMVQLPDVLDCSTCDKRCEQACVSKHKVPVSKILQKLSEAKEANHIISDREIDLHTDICGVSLENPFLLSSSVVASSYEMCARAFEMGWAGAVFKTVCMFPIYEASPRFSAVHDADRSFSGFKNIEQLSEHSLEENLATFRRLKKDYPQKVLVASIMGRDEEEWAYLAKAVTEAGADVIECNFSCPNMMDPSLGTDVGQHPELVEKFTRAVCNATDIPVLAKMTPNLGTMIPPAVAAKKGGASGIAAINTIKSICEVNPDTYETRPSINGYSAVGGYSGAAVKPIALRFIADMAKCEDLSDMHMSAMGGIYTWKDAVEYILLGAKSIQVTTAVMEYGYRIIDDLIDGLSIYLRQKGLKSIYDIVGKSLKNIVDTQELERSTILFPQFHYDLCIGCNRCYVSCRDGGHHAITVDPETRRPKLDGKKCVGCHLCLLVCPQNAIHSAKRRIKKSRN